MGPVHLEHVASALPKHIDTEAHPLLEHTEGDGSEGEEGRCMTMRKSRGWRNGLEAHLNDTDLVGLDHHLPKLGGDEELSLLGH